MGRGLSDQQRRVLLLARESRRNRERRLSGAFGDLSDHERIVYSRGIGTVDLWRPEIVRELYGWEPSRRSGGWRQLRARPLESQQPARLRVRVLRPGSDRASRIQAGAGRPVAHALAT